MANFHRGTTLYCWRYCKDIDGNYFDPATSMTISILTPRTNNDVEDADMVKDDVGKYHYYYTIPNTAISRGTYQVIYKAVDGAHSGKYATSFEAD